MTNFLEYVDLASYSLNVTLVLNPVLFQYLNSDLLTCNRVSSDPHLAKSSGAQRPAYKNSFTDIRYRYDELAQSW